MMTMINFWFWFLSVLGTILVLTGSIGLAGATTFERIKIALAEGLFGLLMIFFALKVLYA